MLQENLNKNVNVIELHCPLCGKLVDRAKLDIDGQWRSECSEYGSDMQRLMTSEHLCEPCYTADAD